MLTHCPPKVSALCLLGWLCASAVFASDARSMGAKGGEPEVSLILAKMRGAAGRLSSVQYQATAVLTRYKEGQEAGKIQTAFRFAAKERGKYRVDIDQKVTGAKAIPMRETEAFDGASYQAFTPRSETVERASQPPKQPLHPCAEVMPFLFVLGPSDRFDYPNLLNSPNWENLSRGASVKGRTRIRDHDCVVIELQRHVVDDDWRYTVSAAADLDYYPLQWNLKAPDRSASLEVLAHEVAATEEGRVVIPTRILTKDFTKSGELLATSETQIEPASLRVNQDIPDDLFTLDAGQARVAVDGDTGNVVRLEGDMLESSRRFLVPGVLAGILGLLGIVYLGRRLRRTAERRSSAVGPEKRS